MIRILARHPATAHHIALQALPAARRGRAARGARRSRGEEVPRDATATCAQTVRADRREPRVLRSEVLPREGEVAVRVRGLRGARGGRRRPTTAAAASRAIAQMGEPLYRCQPPTGYSDTADAWVNTGALVAPPELRAGARGEQACPATVDAGEARASPKTPPTRSGRSMRSPAPRRRRPLRRTRATIETIANAGRRGEAVQTATDEHAAPARSPA